MSGSKVISSERTELAIKYLSGSASDAEMKELEDWVVSDPANRDHFIQLKQAWIWSGLNQKTVAVDEAPAWDTIQKALQVQTPTTTSSSRKVYPLPGRWFSVAAALALVVASAIWILTGLDPGSLDLIAQHEPVEKILPDGSKVILNRQAILSYEFDKVSGTRKATLEGDAFFDVARDEAHPFVIMTQEIMVQVLGTSFYVDGRPGEDEVTVIVESGEVSVGKKGQKVLLKAGEQSVYEKASSQLTRRPNSDQNYKGWISNTLQFEKMQLDEVIEVLNRHYHAKITLATPSLKDCEWTATLRDKSLEATIRIVENTLGLEANHQDDQIILSGEGCQ